MTANPTLRSNFTITLTGEIVLQIDKPMLEMRIKVDPPANSSYDPRISRLQVPLSLFPTGRSLLTATQGTQETFQTLLWEALSLETALHFNDAAHFALADGNLLPDERQQVIAQHTSKTAERLKRSLGIPKKGQASKWSGVELSLAIKGVIQEHPKLPRTYAAIAKRLNVNYGDKAPATGEALRKLIQRYGLNWKTLKSGQ